MNEQMALSELLADDGPLAKMFMAEMERKAKAGDVNIQVSLAKYYINDTLGKPNYKKARHWFRMAADAGDAEACYNLWVMHSRGDGTPRDPKTALSWLRKAAELGYPYAMCCLASLYEEGADGLEQSDSLAVKWYTAAGRLGEDEAYMALGELYLRGFLGHKCPGEAINMFKKAARMGNLQGQMRLAFSYHEGIDVKQDDDESRRWFLMAAKQGNPLAQYNLAVMYHQGLGTLRPSATRAVKWLELSAKAGFDKAQCFLAALLLDGAGTPRNPAKAREWLEKAAAQGSEEAIALLERLDGQQSPASKS